MTRVPGKLQQEWGSTIKPIPDFDSLAHFTLTSDYCRNSDLKSKIMLEGEKIMNILKDAIGDHASNDLYTLGRYEWANKTISFVVYFPTISSLTPVLLEIQNKVDIFLIPNKKTYC